MSLRVELFYFWCSRPFIRNKSRPAFRQNFLEQTYCFKMVYRRNFPAEKRAYARYLRDKEHMKLKEIAQVCDIATSSVHRITSQKFPDVLKKKRLSRGRKSKLSLRQERLILRSIPVLREREGSFTSKRLIQYNRIHGISIAGFETGISGYHYLQARKKGLMSAPIFHGRIWRKACKGLKARMRSQREQSRNGQ